MSYDMHHKIRVYDNKGQERWLRAGTTVPAGWYDTNCQVLNKPHIVKEKTVIDVGYEPGKGIKVLFLEELS